MAWCVVMMRKYNIHQQQLTSNYVHATFLLLFVVSLFLMFKSFFCGKGGWLVDMSLFSQVIIIRVIISSGEEEWELERKE